MDPPRPPSLPRYCATSLRSLWLTQAAWIALSSSKDVRVPPPGAPGGPSIPADPHSGNVAPSLRRVGRSSRLLVLSNPCVTRWSFRTQKRTVVVGRPPRDRPLPCGGRCRPGCASHRSGRPGKWWYGRHEYPGGTGVRPRHHPDTQHRLCAPSSALALCAWLHTGPVTPSHLSRLGGGGWPWS